MTSELILAPRVSIQHAGPGELLVPALIADAGLVEDDQVPSNPLDLLSSSRCKLVRDQNNGLLHIEGKLALDRCHSANLTPRQARMYDKRLAHAGPRVSPARVRIRSRS